MNKIGWCSETYNPVIGCKNNCIYCYAQKINQRFKFIKDWNNPEWREKSFDKKFPKKPQRIFVGSMSEIEFWREGWMLKVLNMVKWNPQHTFIFLTKHPEVYFDWVWPDNCWLGVTITKQVDLYNGRTRDFLGNNANLEYKNMRYISFEPLLGEIFNPGLLLNVDWVILGAETGNRKGKVIPKIEWIDTIVDYCRGTGIPIYLKDSLNSIFPYVIKEFPEVK